MSGLRHAIDIAPLGELSDPKAIVRLATAAEASGWDGISMWDVLGLSMGTHAADPFVTLTAVASATVRLRLIASVIALGRRRPQLVAQSAATLDLVSDGRLVLGLGAGADETDFTAFDDPFERSTRIARMDDGVTIVDRLLRGERLDFDGEGYSVHGVSVGPMPRQRPRPPIWFGGMRPGALRRAAATDGWIAVATSDDGASMALTVAAFADMVSMLQGHRRQLGRSGPFDVAVLGLGGTDADTARSYADAGATWWLESLSPQRGSIDALEALVRRGPPRTIRAQ